MNYQFAALLEVALIAKITDRSVRQIAGDSLTMRTAMKAIHWTLSSVQSGKVAGNHCQRL